MPLVAQELLNPQKHMCPPLPLPRYELNLQYWVVIGSQKHKKAKRAKTLYENIYAIKYIHKTVIAWKVWK